MRNGSIGAFVVSAMVAAGAANAQQFRLTSPDVTDGATMKAEEVYKGFGCTGGNISPALNWAGAPPGAKSFAVTLFDPDAGGGKGWWHWLMFDIPPDTTALLKGAGNPAGQAAPKGSVQSRTDFGSAGYGGPCPPPGERPHRYIFTIYALDLDRLKATKETMPEVVGSDLRDHAIGHTSLTGLYGR
jgi:Raf kinase inhibitor-like YbhB/YbcL family protein